MGKLWYGGTIYTMGREGETVEAVFTDRGKIVDTGRKSVLENQYKHKIEHQIDLQNNVMYPGWIDSHLHIIGHGERLLRLDLAYVQSPQELMQKIWEKDQTLPADEWLIGEGFNENQWDEPRIIHRREIDRICPDRPVVLTRVCRHALIANTKAMELAGITRNTCNPQGGLIDRDEQGEPTGFFLDRAQDLIRQAMPVVNDQYLETAISLAVDDLVQHGIVGGHSEDLNYYGGFNRTYHAFLSSINGRERKFRAHLLVHHEVIDDMEKAGLDYKKGTEWIEMGAMKIFADGALGGRTAWLSEPYEDEPDTTGVAIHSTEDLEKLIQQARQKTLPVAVHAIGDKAVETIVELLQAYPVDQGKRDRIIHAQIMRDDLFKKMKSLNLVVDIQPTFVTSDFPWVLDRIGKTRATHAYPWKTFIKHGIVCAGGSDAPIEEINPLKGIEAAVVRKSDHDGKIYGESERLTPYEAVSLYTKGAAYAIGNEHKQGKIRKGFLADFTILDRDLFQINPEEISKAQVQMTVIDETIVYQK
ncbi:hypothetical protein EDD68_10423 [Melghiribacillus thermohalophilus]|uniref:Amidohydrolase 3 domain-containing protein n=1 Tax=Melghiribacillus thermohalophilus TaxID=1324956 RepID=A0A4R3N9J5_9BACI|nr:amidohydrolase [Melghiribacillus thermohalophilus]TCT24956.1 hypothetical protein EDD68_10423 [Melghiribacillus thermohalophilus]